MQQDGPRMVAIDEQLLSTINARIAQEVEAKIDRKWEEHLKSQRNQLIVSHSICAAGGFALGMVANHYIEKFTSSRPKE